MTAGHMARWPGLHKWCVPWYGKECRRGIVEHGTTITIRPLNTADKVVQDRSVTYLPRPNNIVQHFSQIGTQSHILERR